MFVKSIDVIVDIDKRITDAKIIGSKGLIYLEPDEACDEIQEVIVEYMEEVIEEKLWQMTSSAVIYLIKKYFDGCIMRNVDRQNLRSDLDQCVRQSMEVVASGISNYIAMAVNDNVTEDIIIKSNGAYEMLHPIVQLYEGDYDQSEDEQEEEESQENDEKCADVLDEYNVTIRIADMKL